MKGATSRIRQIEIRLGQPSLAACDMWVASVGQKLPVGKRTWNVATVGYRNSNGTPAGTGNARSEARIQEILKVPARWTPCRSIQEAPGDAVDRCAEACFKGGPAVELEVLAVAPEKPSAANRQAHPRMAI